MVVLSAENISVYYGNYKAVDNVSVSLAKGDYLCVVGANGSGKSTLIKTLLGLIQPKSGTVKHNDCAVGYLSQQNTVQRDFPASVREIVLSGCLRTKGYKPFYSKSERQAADFQLERLGIAHLARSLCAGSDVLVLDEPVAGLDPEVTDELYSLIRTLNRDEKTAILMVSHDVRRAVANASHILHINKQVLFYGSAADYQKTQLYHKMTAMEICCR